MIFSDNDIQQIKAKGLSLKQVEAQIDLFKTGLPYVNLKKAATLGDGILQLNVEEQEQYSKLFENRKDDVSIVKFVPASGAATRMFKFLFHFLEDYNLEEESINAYRNRQKKNDLSVFLVGLEKFPFFEEVIHKSHEKVSNFNTLSYDRQRVEIIKTMLDSDRLNYSYSPKGLLPFHRYNDHVSTAFEEHLFEAAKYASSNGMANLHFTISEKYKHKFDEEFKYIEEEVEEITSTTFNIAFSYQKQATDTIAVTPKNLPFRTIDGNLVFRPSGHGALLENLNAIDADVVFIKNIDNVVVSQYAEEVAFYKKMLAGILLEKQTQAFLYLERLGQGDLTENEISEMAQFLSKQMNGYVSDAFGNYSKEHQMQYLREKLNRPIRVCGMVKNEGEPGGGPFWVKDESGNISLQIVESAQIDKKDETQKDILKSATHFNPVDLVCGIKDYKGNRFDLSKYVDPKTAFITMKTKTGKDLKALELPGLWNGSMAYWNTIFVEVPLITFNPVKTVNDLLKAPHQYL
ncbi:DUF4301 family protein [Aestuariivivens insulae]|uniref:DUF4301 family protein n=1 Tax=Aestuariivivens insulae TaxID=1621988 RepID=UPI001F5B0058|nr:DUF4301 family protein [Aestuariivivens insulae]